MFPTVVIDSVKPYRRDTSPYFVTSWDWGTILKRGPRGTIVSGVEAYKNRTVFRNMIKQEIGMESWNGLRIRNGKSFSSFSFFFLKIGRMNNKNVAINNFSFILYSSYILYS